MIAAVSLSMCQEKAILTQHQLLLEEIIHIENFALV